MRFLGAPLTRRRRAVDHWIISELNMYTDRGHTQIAVPSAMEWSDTDYAFACNNPLNFQVRSVGTVQTFN